MKAFDPAAYPELKELFPELTPVQFETSLLFALGLSQQEIAVTRGVSYKTVKQSIAESKKILEYQSLNALLTAFRVRLDIFALYQCRRP